MPLAARGNDYAADRSPNCLDCLFGNIWDRSHGLRLAACEKESLNLGKEVSDITKTR
jgi:hypothetical protein